MSPRSRRFQLRVKAAPLASWRAFVRRRGARASRPPDGLVEYAGPTQLWIPERPRLLYYFTKDAMFRWWFRAFAGDLPRDIGVIAHGSTPSASASRLVLQAAQSAGVPLVLLGDLDPGDLTAFASLVSGGVALGRPPRARATVLHGGLDDDFLQLVRRHVGKRRFEEECLLRMSAQEGEHLATFKPLCPSLAAMLGAESARLLDEGLKCEVEAVLSPQLCIGAFLADVRRHLAVRLPASLGL